MRITGALFDKFWNSKGQYQSLRNSERLRNSLREKVSELGDTESLDEYVLSLRTGKESTRKIVVQFYDFIGHPESCLYGKRFYDYPFERQLEIAKFLHIPKSPADIRERFDIDERTMRQDLQALEDGISVLGSTIQIQKEKKGRQYFYRTTMHPIFLPLNLTEVYALTVYLERAIRETDPNAEIIRDISNRVKSQLSDYAFKKLFPEESYMREENRYIDDEKLARQRKGILMYLIKSGARCRFFWKENEYEGTIGFLDEGEYVIQLTDGSILNADIKDIEFIAESLEYR